MEAYPRPGRVFLVVVLLLMSASCTQNKGNSESNVDADAACTVVCNALWSCDFERPNCMCHCTTAAELFTPAVFLDFVACVTDAPCDNGWDRPGDCLAQSSELHLDEVSEDRKAACVELAEKMFGTGGGDAAEFCALANGLRKEKWAPAEACLDADSASEVRDCTDSALPPMPDWEFTGACPGRPEVDDSDAIDEPRTRRPGDSCEQLELGIAVCGVDFDGQPAVLVCHSPEDEPMWFVYSICVLECIDGSCIVPDIEGADAGTDQ